jgi:hypothetical protein
MWHAQERADQHDVGVSLANQSAARVGTQVTWPDDDESDGVFGDLHLTTGVVQCTLKSAMHAADSHAVRLVKVGHWPVVLDFAVLDGEGTTWPIAVNGQPHPTSGLARVAAQPLETVLPTAPMAKDLITKVEHVRLIAGFPTHKLNPAMALVHRRINAHRHAEPRVERF